jgi:16S rRNA (cytosine967-C5)-methyltransferase
MPRTFSKPMDGEHNPRTYGKPGDGEHKPRTFGKPMDGEHKPRTFDKPTDGEHKPRTYGKPVGGEWKPHTYGKPADGGQKPHTEGKPEDGERMPLIHENREDGERKPDSFDKPINGEHRPRVFRKPMGGERRPRAFDKPGDGEQRFAPRVRMSARDVALGALKDVAMNGAFAAQALDRQLESARLLPDDRRLATSIFYAAVENRIRIAHILKMFARNVEPEISDVLHIACAQLLYLDRVPDHAAVDEAVKQARAAKGQRLSGFVNGVLRNVVRARDAGELLAPKEGEEEVPLSVEHSVAPELMDKLVETFGEEEAGKIASYLPEKRTQTVRPNLMTTTDEALGNELTGKGIQWEAGLVPHAFLCENAGALANLEGYKTGMFSIQGEGSMLAALAVEPKPGMNILDACAAPGGKSALLCEAMNGTGRVYAWDVHEHRVELIRAAGHRLKLYNLRPTVRDARTPYESFDAFLDAVLVDAPCSGLGVMADKPDLRLKFSQSDVQDLVKIQRDILENCASLVKVGGLLVYSTCTILPEENENQVRDFLAHNPQFAPETDVGYLPETLRPRAKDGMIQLFQHLDGVEGFFIARMRRKCL